MSDNQENKSWEIIVTGDIAFDKNIYEGKRQYPENNNYGTQIKEEWGGVYIIYKLLSNLTNTFESIKKDIEKKRKINIATEENSDENMTLNELENSVNKKKEIWNGNEVRFGLKKDILKFSRIPKCLVTYATWLHESYNVPKEFESNFSAKIKAWKVTSPMGFGTELEEDRENGIKIENLYTNYYKKGLKFRVKKNQMLIFDDGGTNFRKEEEAWKSYLDKFQIKRKDYENLIILKASYPLSKGKLFKTLTETYKDRLTIVTSIDEIRKEDVLISKGISWEQTALDLVKELKKESNRIHNLLNCKYLVINFHSEGALYIQMKNDLIWKCRLIFDPEHLEGEWSKVNNIMGTVIGINDVFTSSIAYGILNDKKLEDLNLEEIISRSLSTIKLYELIGHGSNESQAGFPIEQLCKEMIEPSVTFASAFVPIPDTDNIFCNCYNRSQWTILEGNYYWKKSKDYKPKALFDTGCRYALLGEGELANTPVLKIKDFVTYDRWEIEALRNIMNLIDDYLLNGSSKKPLSIGVFGGPGSGKSFAVKNIAKSREKTSFIEFNLSQFVDVHELEGAFHQVRDEILKGKTPVVFWDEFDSQEYRWLQYLLAPMQDGAFQEGQLTHPIGTCIFIFAGATSYSYEKFGVMDPDEPVTSNDCNKISNDDEPIEKATDHTVSNSDECAEKTLIKYENNVKRRRDFILKKGPDFISRLNGYLNVKGPNQLVLLDQFGNPCKDKSGNLVKDKNDIFYPIRRALYIRNAFKNKCDKKGILKMDYGIINALIKTKTYKHGARSLMHILSYTKSSKTERVQRSSLPTRSVLEMVVDYDDFINIMNKDCNYLFITYSIAPEIHGNWSKFSNIESSYHKEYNHLPSHSKTDNIEAAKRIPALIEVAGCDITEDADEQKGFNFNQKLMKKFPKFKGIDIKEFKDYLYEKLVDIVYKKEKNSYVKTYPNKSDIFINYMLRNHLQILKKDYPYCKGKNKKQIQICIRNAIFDDIAKILIKKKLNDPVLDILTKVKKTFGIIYELAETEHDGWHEVKIDNGWDKAVSKKLRNDDRKLHHDMIPFEELLIGEILKDVDAICNIEENLKKVGLYIKEKL